MKQLTKKKSKLKVCVICGKAVERVSRKGNCLTCSESLVFDSIEQLQSKEGDIYDKWEKNITAGIKKARNKKK